MYGFWFCCTLNFIFHFPFTPFSTLLRVAGHRTGLDSTLDQVPKDHWSSFSFCVRNFGHLELSRGPKDYVHQTPTPGCVKIQNFEGPLYFYLVKESCISKSYKYPSCNTIYPFFLGESLRECHFRCFNQYNSVLISCPLVPLPCS